MNPLPSKDEIEELCMLGERVAREYVLSAVDRHLVRSLDVRVVSEVSESGIDFSVDVELRVDPVVTMEIERLADAAAERALGAIDDALRARRSA
ncbi:MAG: DUF3194 domain-containing protein [Candidatus Verstraetearchaeota archaeon]|nr:DUF3194 domain-containing protein [Candidatus Verstraetearchaeota archaeon]